MTITLPAMTLMLVVLAHMMRMTRAAMLDVMSQPLYRDGAAQGTAAMADGGAARAAQRAGADHQRRGLNLAYLIVGVVVVEVVFVYPGIGQYLVDAVSKRDVPVVQACGLIFAVAYIGLNMIADVVVDPGQSAPQASAMTAITADEAHPALVGLHP